MTFERKLTKAYNNLVAYVLNSVVLDPIANETITLIRGNCLEASESLAQMMYI